MKAVVRFNISSVSVERMIIGLTKVGQDTKINNNIGFLFKTRNFVNVNVLSSELN